MDPLRDKKMKACLDLGGEETTARPPGEENEHLDRGEREDICDHGLSGGLKVKVTVNNI